MLGRWKFLPVMFLIILLIVSSISISNVTAARAVDYSIDITDPEYDVVGDGFDSTMGDDADITAFTCSPWTSTATGSRTGPCR